MKSLLNGCALFALLIASVANAQTATEPTLFPGTGIWGVNIHNPYRSQMKELGAQWVRISDRWNEMEAKEKGQYNWANSDKLIQYYSDNGMKMIFVLLAEDMSPLYENVKGDKTQVIAAVTDWMGAMAARYKGKGIVWEISNEPEAFHMGNYWNDPATYTAMAREAAKKIKAADPTAKVGALSMAWVDRDYMIRCLEDGLLKDGTIDLLTYHGYHRRSMQPEGGLAADVQWMRIIAAKYAPAGKTVGVVDSERGYAITPAGKQKHWSVWRNYTSSESEQAAYLARHFLEEINLGIEMSIWYKDMNGEDSYSLYYADEKDSKGLRPIGHVFRNLAALLPDNPKELTNNAYAITLVDLPDQNSAPDGCIEVRSYLQKRPEGNRLILAIWNPVEAFNGKILSTRERIGEFIYETWRDVRPDDVVDYPLQARISGLKPESIKKMALYNVLAPTTAGATTEISPDLGDKSIKTPVIKVGPTPVIVVVDIAK